MVYKSKQLKSPILCTKIRRKTQPTLKPHILTTSYKMPKLDWIVLDRAVSIERSECLALWTLRILLKFRAVVEYGDTAPIGFFVWKNLLPGISTSTSIHKTKQSSGHSEDSFRLFYLFIPLVWVFIAGSPECTQRPTRGGLSEEQPPLAQTLSYNNNKASSFLFR